jgi:hypothetical protein
MPLKLNSTSGGSVTLQEPTTASNRTLTLPDATGTVNTSGAVNEVPAGSASTPSIYPTGDTNTGIFFPAADTIAFSEGGVESARIDSSGNLLVGTTTTRSSYITTVCDSTYNGVTVTADITSARTACSFRNPNGAVGSITTSSSSTAYNTSSDYRLKENVQPMTGALEKIAALKPVTYKWKADASNGEGFIAHELAEVAPGCVTGEKDAVDANGNPVYQGIDTSFLVATLTAGLQEAVAMIEELKAKVAALEAK